LRVEQRNTFRLILGKLLCFKFSHDNRPAAREVEEIDTEESSR